MTNEQIKKAVEKLNKNIMSHSEAVFGIHEATNRITIKIIDKDTKKVIKELPPEKTLDMIAKVWEKQAIIQQEESLHMTEGDNGEALLNEKVQKLVVRSRIQAAIMIITVVAAFTLAVFSAMNMKSEMLSMVAGITVDLPVL